MGRRLFQVVAVLLVASAVLFVALRVLPGDPARSLLGQQATEAQVEQKREDLGLNEPVVQQYADWLGGVVRGDLGESFAGESVTELMVDAFPVTIQLALYGLVLALIVSLGLGLIAVRRPGGAADSLTALLASVSAAVPAFVWSLVLILVLALSWDLLPSSGYVSPWQDPVEGVRSLLMPVLALSLPAIGTMARVLRASLLEIRREPYVAFARSKGLSERRILLVHTLKAAAVPLAAITGAEFAYMLGDAVIVEYIFSLPGMGKLMIDSFFDRDFPIIQGVALIYTLLVLVGTMLVDLASKRLDPRVDLAGSAA